MSKKRPEAAPCTFRLHGARILLLLGILLLAAPLKVNAQAPSFPDWRFGVVESYVTPQEADALGVAWTRLTIHWAEVQAAGPDSWTPQIDEAHISAEEERGRLMVGLLIGIPSWARDRKGLPAGLWLPPDHPENLWATFVRRSVDHYRRSIDHWVIWNEPDIWDESAPGHTWEGSVQDFARLQQVAYLVTKETNPQATVHLPAFTYYWDANYGREQYLGRLLEALSSLPQAAEHNYYFDVVTAHVYFQPHAVYEIITTFKELLADQGLHQPLWLVETNAPPSADPAWPVSDPTFRVTLGEQAAFVPQALASALAAGAERMALYKLQDVPGDEAANPEPFGLLRRDGSRRPAFATYQVAARYLAGTRDARRERWDGVGQIRLDQGDFSTTVLFARLPTSQQARIPAHSETAVLVDMWGSRQTIRATEGFFRVSLPPALCSHSIGDYCMIGGTTYYLVQAKEGHTLPAKLPAPALSPTGTPLPMPAPSPVATPTATAAVAEPTAQPLPTSSPASSPTAPAEIVEAPRNEALASFPERVTFRLQLPHGSEAQEATLNYDVVQRTCIEAGSQVPVAVQDGHLEWTWIMSRSGNPPPGTQLWWQWTWQDDRGKTFATPRQSIILADERFEWRTVRDQEKGIRLNWYRGDEVGPLLLEAAVAGLERLETEMGIELQNEVTFYIYGEAEDMRQAVLYVQDWAGGVAFDNYGTILIGVPPDRAAQWGRETVRHELAHLVLGQFGRSCLGGNRPTWLEEGLAVYAEGPPDEDTREDLRQGIEDGLFMPLRSLNGSFPADDARAGLAYSQSYSVVNYLLQTYGAQKLQALIQTLAQGLGYDEALQSVYGFNVDGLEEEWRRAIGAAPRAIPPTPTPLVAAAVPTVAPLEVERVHPTPAAAATAAAPSAESGPVLCGLGLAPLLLFGAWGVFLRKRHPGAGQRPRHRP